MKIAIVGSGISGLVVASGLHQRGHEITVFEAAPRCGGHANTVVLSTEQGPLALDTGFLVFNDVNYPNLSRLFESLGVESVNSDMSFSVRCERQDIEYNGTNLRTLFAQPANALRPSHWRMLADILRFHRLLRRDYLITHGGRAQPTVDRRALPESVTVAAFLARHDLGPAFAARYLLPLGASLWSCGAAQFRDFPMQFVVEFLANHRMLQVDDRPQWKTVKGGSIEYVRRLIEPLGGAIRISTAVRAVRRLQRGSVEVLTATGAREIYDEVVLATHADQSLRMVTDPDPFERETLDQFPYQLNSAVLHTDASFLPTRRAAWGSWNYQIPRDGDDHATVTYYLNKLQCLDSELAYCVSLNPTRQVPSSHILRRFRYEHPLFTRGRGQAQAMRESMLRRGGISYCGAYWGFGFHEDGMVSGLDVLEAFNASAVARAA